MFRTIVVGVSLVLLALTVCPAAFAAGATAPGPTVAESQAAAAATGGQPIAPPPGRPSRFDGTPSLTMPSPCVVSSLRVLNPQRMPMFRERLSLTDDQHTKIQDIINKAEEDLKPLIQTQKKAAEEFVTFLTKAGATEAELQAAGDAATKAEQAILNRKISELYAMRAVLQADQVAELNKMIEETTTVWRLGSRTMPTAVPPAPAGVPPRKPATEKKLPGF